MSIFQCMAKIKKHSTKNISHSRKLKRIYRAAIMMVIGGAGLGYQYHSIAATDPFVTCQDMRNAGRQMLSWGNSGYTPWSIELNSDDLFFVTFPGGRHNFPCDDDFIYPQ